MAAGMERQPGRSAAVAQFGRVGCFGASQSFCLRRQASWLKVWRGAGCNLARRNEHTSRTEARLTRNGGGQVWSRLCKIPKCLEWHSNRMTNFLNPSFCAAVNEAAYAKHAEVTVLSLDDWEKEWEKNSQRNVQPKLLPVDFQSSPAAVAQSN